MSKRKKKTTTVKGSQLFDVDVNLISLVERPSSRVPWSIMKSEDQSGGNDMKKLDLMTLFQKSDNDPVVVSVLVKGEASEEMLAVLKDNGFNVEKSEFDEEQGITTYDQEVTYDGDTSVIKMSDEVAVVVPVVAKMDSSFAEMAAARGFYPSINIATDLLQCELHRAIEKSDSPSAASEKVSSLVSDFGSFMSNMVGGLPAMVFKAENALANIEAAEITPVDEDASEDEEVETEAVEKTEGEEVDGDDTDEVTDEAEAEAEVEKTEDEQVEDLDAPLDTGTGATGTVSKSEAEDEQVDEEAEEAEVEKMAGKKKPAAKKKKNDDDEEDGEYVEKSEDDAATAIAAAVMKQLEPRLSKIESSVSAQAETIEKQEKALGQPLASVFGTQGDFEYVEKSERASLPIDTGLGRTK